MSWIENRPAVPQIGTVSNHGHGNVRHRRGLGTGRGLPHSLGQGASPSAGGSEFSDQATDVHVQLQAHHYLPTSTPAGQLGQLFQANGTLLGSSVNLHGLPPLIHVRPLGPKPRLTTVRNPSFGQLRVLEEQFGTGSAPILVTAQQIGQIDQTVGSLTVLLAVVSPVLAVVLGLPIWFVVGRAMKPVEAVRVAVADISDQDLEERVPSPGTGDELERLVDTMNRMLERLQATIKRERRFVADASHELRNPIAGMRAALESGNGSRAEMAESHDAALSALQRPQDLADELLVSTRSIMPRRLRQQSP